ncbi:hypothetical protein ACFLZ8_03250 [Planctomycetota bacterium]
MKNAGEKIVFNDQISIIDRLQASLEKQIELVHQGESAGKKFDSLNVQADRLVSMIARKGILELKENAGKKHALQITYDHLRLVLAAQKEQTSNELNKIRKGKKMLEVYRGSI